MPIEITLPQLSEDALDGLIVAWRVQPGQAVQAGQVLVEVETDKVVLEIESPRPGVLAAQAAPAGGYVWAGGILAVVAEAGEDAQALAAQYAERLSAMPTEPAESAKAAQPPAACPLGADYPPVLKAIPLKGFRGVIARRMSHSIRDLPQYQVTVDCDAQPLQDFRKALRKQPETKAVSLNAVILKCVADALRRHPMVNSTIMGDTIYQHSQANIGMAVASPQGVLSPVVRDVGGKGIAAVSQELEQLIEAARTKRLGAQQLHGGTFTVSSLGALGVRDFVAIVVPPQVAILALGGIRNEAVVKQDQLAAGKRMAMTLSSDHRAVDGAVAAEFLKTLKELLENPAPVVI
jgi:pyruvate dehydrogenase E2 component (dihydrolipoamide acetyltransferase)